MSLEDVAYVPKKELQSVEGFDEVIAAELQRRASDILLTQEIANQEKINEVKPAADLLDVQEMTEELARQLAAHEVLTRDDLAEMSVDDLKEIIEIDDESAAKLIMAARAHWFAEEERK